MGGSVVIFGAGAVDANAAIFLDRLGYKVTLIESQEDILAGAPLAAFITHSDGLEYFKEDHQQTGRDCIDGALVKHLLYPIAALRTEVAGPAVPIHFLVAKRAVGWGGLTYQAFCESTEILNRHYESRVTQLVRRVGSADAVWPLIGGQPVAARELRRQEFRGCPKAAFGFAGASYGANMPHYYAMVRAHLRKSGVDLRLEADTRMIEPLGGQYRIRLAHGEPIMADHIILAAGHHNPRLAAMINGDIPQWPGRYRLQCITLISLPKTRVDKRRHSMSRINFTLKDAAGGMFACIVKPTAHRRGMAAIYLPTKRGGQFRSHEVGEGRPPLPWKAWDRLLGKAMKADHRNVVATLRNIRRLYPFLNRKVRVIRTVRKPLFIAATEENRGGREDNMRVLVRDGPLTPDGRVFAYHAPKWTNAELTALIAVDNVQGQEMGADARAGRILGDDFTLGNTDVYAFARDFDFLGVHAELEDAYAYAERAMLPRDVVDPAAAIFQPPQP